MTWNFGSRSKIDFKVKYIRLKDFFDEIKCKKFLILIVYGRRHSKLFTNCHVSWDTLWIKFVMHTRDIHK